MKYIDIHAHLNFSDFDSDRGELIKQAEENDLFMINIGTNLITSKEVFELSNKSKNLFAIIGFHPIYVDNKTDTNQVISDLSSMIKEKVVGIGECGLDYFHIEAKEEDEIRKIKDKQKEIFRAQIELAINNNLPIMIHCRNAYSDVLEILEDYKGKVFGNVHFFAGTLDEANKFLDLNFTLSFTGVITFAKQYEELVKFVPLDKIHGETDCPYVAPAPYRGKRNEPAYVLEVYKKIAEIKGLDFEVVREALVNNAKKVFLLDN